MYGERDYSLTLLVTAGHAYVQNGQKNGQIVYGERDYSLTLLATAGKDGQKWSNSVCRA